MPRTILSGRLHWHFAGAVVSKVTPAAVQVVLIMIVARGGSLEDVGLLSLASAAAFGCGAIGEMGFQTSLSVPKPYLGVDAPPVAATQRLRFLAAAGGSALYLALWLLGLGGHEPVLLAALPLPAILALGYGYAGAMNAGARLDLEGRVTTIESIGVIVAALAATMVLEPVLACLLALTVVRTIGTVARARIVRGLKQSRTAAVSRLASLQGTFLLVTVATMLQSQADLIIGGFAADLALVGIFAPLLRTAYGSLLVAEGLSWSLFGKGGDASGDELDDYGRLRWWTTGWRPLGAGVGAGLALVFFLVASPLLNFILDESLPDLSSAILIFSLVIVVRFGTSMQGVQIVRIGEQRRRLPWLAASAAVLGVTSWVAFSASSLEGLALARLASESLLFGGYLLVLRGARRRHGHAHREATQAESTGTRATTQ